MGEMRGRPFAYVALTLSVWVAARVIVSNGGSEKVAASSFAATVQQSRSNGAPIAPVNAAAVQMVRLTSDGEPARRSMHPYKITTNFRLTPAQDPWQDGGRPLGLSLLALVASRDEPQSAGRDTPPSKALARMGEAGQPNQAQRAKKSWGGNVYAYSFWRFSTGGAQALAPGAQYGGSQSGIIATIDPFDAPDRGLSLLARGSMTPDGDEREVGLGFRWRPSNSWPVTVTAERRFRANAPDGFAAYLAGGVDAQPIVGDWSLNAFGQAGYVAGRSGGGFFDAQARMMYPLMKIGAIPVSAGAGSWAGGQKGAVRVDVGPAIAAKVDTGSIPLLIQIDWRLRAAGNAEPKNGLALTVSTGF